MRRCAFLTLAEPGNFVIDDELAVAPLAELGVAVDNVAWDADNVDWPGYELVVIRSPWDYQRAPRAFLARLELIVSAGVRLENSLRLVHWNLDKTYLRALERRGVPVVPTVWRDRLSGAGLAGLFEALGCGEIVIKPTVSANAEGTFRLDRAAAAAARDEIGKYYAGRALLAQPFVGSILAEGEYSLCYFNGVFSHAIRKTPSEGDFRVQEEHGGTIVPIDPAPDLLAAADRVLAALPGQPLYARVDLVAAPAAGVYWLMEVELVEPSLYLRMDEEAPRRFARAIAAVIGAES